MLGTVLEMLGDASPERLNVPAHCAFRLVGIVAANGLEDLLVLLLEAVVVIGCRE
jgi:hypothetical protein